MILKVYAWTCTLCDYGKTYDPQLTQPPETCPVCQNSEKEAYKAPKQLPMNYFKEHKE